MQKLKIIYEDKYLIVVNKPTNLLTISTEKEKEKTLFHEVLTYEKKKNKNNKVFIVHRLDKETSGIIIFAKSEKVKKILQNNWNNVNRYYVAVVKGHVEQSGEIKSYLNETSTFFTYSSKKNGLFAHTKYKPLKSNKKYTLLEIQILTGRKHQIRVHMHDIKHPILGDKKYGSTVDPLKKLCLTANRIEFVHPITKQDISIEISIPIEFLKLFL